MHARIEYPVLLLTAPPDEVDSLARLQDLLRELVREQPRGDHYRVQLVLELPEEPMVFLLEGSGARGGHV